MSVSTRILTFDIGIRNLAWCLLEKEGSAWNIIGWENYDLLAGSPTEEAKKAAIVSCGTCKKKGTHTIRVGLTAIKEARCKKHCPPEYPPLSDLSGAILKNIPALPVLQKMVVTAKKLRKADIVELLEKKFAMPIEKIKVTKAIQTELGVIHTALQTFVTARAAIFRTANKILLENQPAFKNPTMKSIQILLFATIRERVLPGISSIGFVHAGKKTKGSTGGDKGYAERKKASEIRTGEWFQKESVTDKLKWTQFLAGNNKKNDLCDCLCMCLDAHGQK